MRVLPELRKFSDMCRSNTSAAPRAVARDSLEIIPTRVTGESLDKLILIEPPGRALSCASRLAAPNTITIDSRALALLRIHAINHHVARFGIYVASSHGTLRARRERHVVGAHARIHQPECLIAGSHLYSIRRTLHHGATLRLRGCRAFQQQPRGHHGHDTGQRHGRTPTGRSEERRGGEDS